MSTLDIHPSAFVGERVRLGSRVRIGLGAIVEDDVTIGDGCEIGPHAFVGRHTVMGRHNRIGFAAQVGGEPQVVSWERCDSRVVLGDGNTVREYASLHRAMTSGAETIIGNNCYLMGSSHVAHDCRLGDHVILVNGALIAGHVEIGDRTFISGNCVVHQFVRIGRLVMVRGLTALGKDVVPFALVDQSNTVRTLNKVGLRRAGFSRDTLADLDRAFREIFRSERPLFQSLDALEQTPASTETREMIAFIRSSKRGICQWYSTQVKRNAARARDEAEDVSSDV